MKKYFLAFLFFAYIFIFGLFRLSPNVLSVSAADCWDGWLTWVHPGVLQCARSSMIQECQSNGDWIDYYDCVNISPSTLCENIGSSPNYSARCQGQPEAPSPTPSPAPTNVPLPKCTGDYSKDEQKCENQNVMVCEVVTHGNAATGITVTAEWKQKLPASTNTCTIGGCTPHGTAPNRTASCNLTQPTPTITPTPTLIPGTEPTPDPTVKCTFEKVERNAIGFPITKTYQYNAGSQTCGVESSLQLFEHVYKCNNSGDMVDIGTCYGIASEGCHDSGSSAPDTDSICTNGFTPTLTDSECSRKTSAAQQMIPIPGVNCGIPEADLPEGADRSALACCYSAAADLEVMPLYCFIGYPGGEEMLTKLSDKINACFKNLPDISNCSQETLDKNALNIGAIQKALKEIPFCMPRTKPKNTLTGGGAVSTGTLAGQADGSGNPLCTCEYDKTDTSKLCDTIMTTDKDGKIIPDAAEQKNCEDCMLDISGAQGDGIWTALGCVNISTENGFIQSLLRLGISLGGAFALLCNIYGAYLYQTSRGNPERLKKAQDLITSCVTGMLLIIFSVFILRLIGYNILRIPGFG